MQHPIELKNPRLIKALLRQPVDRTPVWLMRQAGRYLPEYRRLREQAGDFLTLCKTPELAAQVTLQPLQRFPLDAAIIFSDILVLPEAMGLSLTFAQGEGPVFLNPIRELQDLQRLKRPDPSQDLGYVLEAIRLTKAELAGAVPIIGFAGSPWTVATYMVEGATSKQFNRIRGLLYGAPKTLQALLELLIVATQDYLNAQIAAGVDVVMLFDTWGGLLAKEQYCEFSLTPMARIIAGLQRHHLGKQIPVIVFSKNGGQHLIEIAATGCDAIGLDWLADIEAACAAVSDRVALQGNLDPAALYAPIPRLEQEVRRILHAFRQAPGHIFNLGHGIYPDIGLDKVAALVETVQAYRPH